MYTCGFFGTLTTDSKGGKGGEGGGGDGGVGVKGEQSSVGVREARRRHQGEPSGRPPLQVHLGWRVPPAAIDDEGLLWTWGRNAEGQLGLGDAALETQRDVIEPKNVSLDFFNGKHARPRRVRRSSLPPSTKTGRCGRGEKGKLISATRTFTFPSSVARTTSPCRGG